MDLLKYCYISLKTMTEQPPIDYTLFSDDSLDHWSEHWDSDLHIWENLANILQDSVLVPFASLQVPLAVAYLCTPSALSKILPILFCHGRKPGVGKSTIGKLASYCWGVPICTSSDTFASIRNHLLEHKFYVHNDEVYEQNTILVLDDIDKRFFQEKVDIYRLFKFGYDRATDTIQIAGERGQNMKFRCFCGRVVSSVSPLYADPDFPELKRRCFVLKFKKAEDFEEKEAERFEVGTFYEGSESDAVLGSKQYKFNVLERLNLDTVNWKGFENHLKDYWLNRDNCASFVMWRKQLNARKRSFELPKNLSGENWTISTDVLATGLTMGIWPTLTDAIQFISKYWEWANSTKESEYGATLKLLRELIQNEIGEIVAINKQAGYEVIPLSISPKKIKSALEKGLRKGELDLSPSIENVKNCMRELGWKLELREWIPDRG